MSWPWTKLPALEVGPSFVRIKEVPASPLGRARSISLGGFTSPEAWMPQGKAEFRLCRARSDFGDPEEVFPKR